MKRVSIFSLPFLLIVSCSLFYSDKTPTSYSIVYSVSGTGACVNASLTYENSSGGTSQISAAQLPWTSSFTVTDTHQFLYISAQNNFSTGSITTSISINGVVKSTSTSTGAYVISTSSGSVYSLQ